MTAVRMKQCGEGDGLVIRKARDNSLKLILGEHDLFVEFLRDFIDIDILKNVSASDIEDVSERFLPLFEENKDSDTVKRINLKGGVPLFVIAIIEHESKVNFRASYKMLQYIMLVLDNYEKEADEKKKGIHLTKDFKYPPVLPIVFYDGEGKWTAETNFLNKTYLREIFQKYIPKFEYELVNLNDYSQEDLVKFGDTLSWLMLIDKIKKADGIHALGNLPADYVEKLALNIPPHLNKLIADVITVLLTKINVPQNEVEIITEKIHRKEYQEMFTLLEDYDVQATRREAREEGVLKGKLEAALNIIKEMHLPLSEAMSVTKLHESSRERLIDELRSMNILYTE
jgi:hypothetical protein